MDEARSGLDSFARADLNGARERVEALHARTQQAVADHESWVSVASGHRAELLARRAELLAEHDRVASIDPETVRDAADRLASVLDPPRVPDPAAALLADRLDEILDAEEERQHRREAAEGLLGEAEARLADAWAELRGVLDQERTASTDPDVVRQLERVRDEIYELEERGGRIAAVRSRRRIDELRAEEAELLDRLGFDTYSSFVMGVPTARAEAERAMRIDAAQARIDTLQRDVDRLRADSPGGEEEQRIRAERAAITDEAARLLGADAQAIGRLTSIELGELLRSTHLPTPPETSAEVLSAAGRLAAALSAAGEEPPSTAIDPTAMLEDARRWLAGVESRPDLLRTLVARVDEVDRELARLERDRTAADDGGRLADLRAELAAADERVMDAERRLEAHLSAMGELADLRTEELELRERRHALQASIDERERVLAVIDAATAPPPFRGPVPPPTQDVAAVPPVGPGALPSGPASPGAVSSGPVSSGTVSSGTPVPAAGTEGATAEGSLLAVSAPGPSPGVFGPVSREWRVLSRLADLRQVGMVGSVPLMVAGLTAEPGDTEAVLHRLEVMSDLVQVVVTTDDERVAAWADRLGGSAAVVRW
jgi:chromosome segregation ATPase